MSEPAVVEVLASPAYRPSAVQMARALHELCASEPAVSELEALMSPAPT